MLTPEHKKSNCDVCAIRADITFHRFVILVENSLLLCKVNRHLPLIMMLMRMLILLIMIIMMSMMMMMLIKKVSQDDHYDMIMYSNSKISQASIKLEDSKEGL